MSALISLAAAALLDARLRTSEATTAKPRPCSPARAASTAALSASRFVWKAISSITPMISAILLLAALISLIAATAAPTTLPPRSACSRAATAHDARDRDIGEEEAPVDVLHIDQVRKIVDERSEHRPVTARRNPCAGAAIAGKEVRGNPGGPDGPGGRLSAPPLRQRTSAAA